ncbi:hypothetical protein D8S78_06190 [Natrialba swarupiae]|nr:hypothetical protein [Natrialba swarupiae]
MATWAESSPTRVSSASTVDSSASRSASPVSTFSGFDRRSRQRMRPQLARRRGDTPERRQAREVCRPVRERLESFYGGFPFSLDVSPDGFIRNLGLERGWNLGEQRFGAVDPLFDERVGDLDGELLVVGRAIDLGDRRQFLVGVDRRRTVGTVGQDGETAGRYRARERGARRASDGPEKSPTRPVSVVKSVRRHRRSPSSTSG